MASAWLPNLDASHQFQVHTDTTDFFQLEYNDILILGNKPYLIRHNAKEVRWGYEDEKYWVKRAINLADGSLNIIKLVFHETFMINISDISFECFRSPRKEARILKLVDGHKNFMHGTSIEDEKGNIIRIIRFINGKTLPEYIESLKMNHEAYFFEQFPVILNNFTESVEAIRFLHDHGEKHGDIERSHILIDRASGIYRWIDFDYNYKHRESLASYDMFGLGNILIFLAGKGDLLLQDMKKEGHPAIDILRDEDLNIVFNNRVANLRKIYPYIPESFNNILMHFSKGTNWFYENTSQLLDDLKEFGRFRHNSGG